MVLGAIFFVDYSEYDIYLLPLVFYRNQQGLVDRFHLRAILHRVSLIYILHSKEDAIDYSQIIKHVRPEALFRDAMLSFLVDQKVPSIVKSGFRIIPCPNRILVFFSGWGFSCAFLVTSH